MKIIVWVLPVLLVLACGKKDPFEGSVWSDGEISEYTILVEGDSAGVARFVVTHDAWDGQPAYHLQGIKSLFLEDSEISDSFDVYLRPADLRPLYSDRTIRGPLNMRYTAEYVASEGKRGVNISKESLEDGAVQEAKMGLEETAQDGNATYYVLRTLDFTREEGGVFMSFSSVLALEAAARWNLLGEEVQLGIPCDKVGLNVGGRGIYLWIEKAAPRRIVRQDDIGPRVVMKLRVPD
jgi:hypothetical protein